MPKNYFLRSTLLGLIASMAPTALAAESPALSIPRIGIPPGADAPADWNGGGLLLTALAGDGMELPAFAQFGATARVAWDDEGVRALVEVSDATPWESAEAERLYEGDAVELMVSHGGMVQLIATAGRTSSQKTPRQQVLDYRPDDLKKLAGPPTGRATVRTTPEGYIAELAIPWRNFFATTGAKPQEGEPVGLRVTIGGRSDGDTPRMQFFLLPPGVKYDFTALPEARLATTAAHAPAAVAWGNHDEALTTTWVNVLATPDRAGQPVTVTEGTHTLARGILAADGPRAALSLSFPAAPPGNQRGPLLVSIAGQPVDTLALPDVNEARRRLILTGLAEHAVMQAEPRQWWTPSFGGPIFREPVFPALAYPDPARIERMVGKLTFKTTWYDRDLQPVERPTAEGRYGAIVTATLADGGTLTHYHSLIYAPLKPERDWWHALRKTLGNPIRYDYHVRTPAGYAQDPAKKWPVLFYLHGSGGGDDMKDVMENGPQAAAKNRPDFPFVVVSLRSPDGWHPPAVADVVDAVAAHYRIDPDRTYLTGFSMGGIGTWEIAFDQPHRFAAIAPVGGRRGHPGRAAELRHLPVWIFNGGADGTTTPADAKLACDALKAVGAPVRYTEIPEAGHLQSHDSVYHGTELYDWLLQQRR